MTRSQMVLLINHPKLKDPVITAITLELEQEDDGRWGAEVVDLPGVMAYGSTESEAKQAAGKLAIEVLSERFDKPARPPLPPPREIQEGYVPPRPGAKPLRCRFGFHDWRRRERERRTDWGKKPGRLEPCNIEWTEYFRQCRRCNKTKAGWPYDQRLDGPVPPEPMPWEPGT